MKGLVKNISLRFFAIFMAMVLCMPCSIKREIKQFFDIQPANVENTGNKINYCPNVFREASQGVAAPHQEKRTADYPQNAAFTDFKKGMYSPYNPIAFKGERISAPIPIYILHEQYLI